MRLINLEGLTASIARWPSNGARGTRHVGGQRDAAGSCGERLLNRNARLAGYARHPDPGANPPLQFRAQFSEKGLGSGDGGVPLSAPTRSASPGVSPGLGSSGGGGRRRSMPWAGPRTVGRARLKTGEAVRTLCSCMRPPSTEIGRRRPGGERCAGPLVTAAVAAAVAAGVTRRAACLCRTCLTALARSAGSGTRPCRRR